MNKFKNVQIFGTGYLVINKLKLKEQIEGNFFDK